MIPARGPTCARSGCLACSIAVNPRANKVDTPVRTARSSKRYSAVAGVAKEVNTSVALTRSVKVFMAMRVTDRHGKVVLLGSLHPEYRQVVETYLTQLNCEVVVVPTPEGTADPAFEDTPFTPPPVRARKRIARRRGISPLVVLFFCGAITLACLLGLGFLLRVAGK